MKINGYNTGLIATSSIVHATQLLFMPMSIPEKFEEIALQLSESNVDYFIGEEKNILIKERTKETL